MKPINFSFQINSLLADLKKKANPETKKWWEGYVKHSAPFLGVKMADIRTIVHFWYQTQVAELIDPGQQLDLALLLFEGQFTEEKLAGTLFLQEILIPSHGINCSADVDKFSYLFSNKLIYDWNICDWFSIKVLGSLIKFNGMPCAEKISAWYSAADLWQARASIVAFVPVAATDQYYPLIKKSCEIIIKREERFAKTAVGWIMREISKYDQEWVIQVIHQNIQYFSLESMKNAIKNLDAQDREIIRNLYQEKRART